MNWYKQAYGERNFKPVKFLKELRQYGVIIEREGAGSVKMLYNTSNGERTSFHYHPSKSVSPGAVKKMLSDLGISMKDFMNKNKKENIKEKEVSNIKKEDIPAWKNQPWFLEKQKYVTAPNWETQNELV